MGILNTFILEIAVLIVAAPLGGVAMMSRRWPPAARGGARGGTQEGTLRSGCLIAARLAVPSTIVAGVSAVVALAANGGVPGAVLGAVHRAGQTPFADAIAPVAISHATLWAATMALAAMGALCATCVADPLDAAAGAVTLALAVSAGVLVAGPAIVDAPLGAIDAALLASPLVATASAANLDLLRGDVLYHLSPLAHGRFDYPAWWTASVCYAGFALLCIAAATLNLDRRHHFSERTSS